MNPGWGWRPRSLRARLLAWLVALHLLAIAATVWLSYVAYGRLVNNFMDDQMRLVAESHATHHRLPTLQPVSSDDVVQRGAFVVQVWSADGGTLQATSWTGLALPLQPQPGFGDVRLGPGDAGGWRVYTLAAEPPDGSPRVQVVQNDGFRRHRIVRRALLESLPILLLLPITLGLLWAIVSAASRSLRIVARDLAAQDEASPDGVPVARVPEEIAPLVAAINSLLGRLRGALSAQRHFMQDAAHELRTPMAAIGLQIENLRAHVPHGDAAERFAQLEGGVVDVRLHTVDGQPVVDVVDDGPGIAADQLERVFDRFYRVAGAPAGGSGLGLAIAQAAALRNGLRIVLANRSDRSGLLARVHLPPIAA